MKNTVYLKSTWADIKHSFGRFIAVILIIFMGVLLFVGIKSVGPDLERAAADYLKDHKVADLQIVGTGGLTKEDQSLVEKIADAQTELGYSFPLLEPEKERNLQIYSYDPTQKQNRLTLVDGELPQAKSEGVIDARLKQDYPLGEKITLDSDQLSTKEITIVGYVQSPLYVDQTERGVTTIGDGELDGFLYLPVKNFTGDIYSILYVTWPQLQKYDPFSATYQTKFDQLQDQVTEAFDQRKTERKKELVTTGEKELADQQQTLTAKQQELTEAATKLAQAADQLAQQKTQVAQQKAQVAATAGEETANARFASAETQLADSEKTLQQQQAVLQTNQQKLTDGQKELIAAKKDLATIKTPSYLLTERKNNPGFNEYISLSDRIDAIGNVFPVFFFLIAILITFTTITRMIEENRKEIGTLKALGYRNGEIASKYILYALLTALIGTLGGILVGTKLIPPIVFAILKGTYLFPSYPTDFWFWPIFLAVIASLIATLGSTGYVLVKDLREKPTALLQAKAPKAGKRVYLERITPIWRRMNFNQKITYRNLLRYKARMILTILGIAGCTGLMVAGFGLNDSISGATDKQFHELTRYQTIVTLADQVDGAKENKVSQALAQEGSVQAYLPIHSEQIIFKQKTVTDQTASLYVTDQPNKLPDYFALRAASGGKKVKLSNEGAVISERLARIYQAKIGGTLTFQTADGEKIKLKIANIVENYLGHNVFMTQEYYQKIAPDPELLNTYLVKNDSLSTKKEDQLARRLQATDQVVNTTFMSRQIAKQGSASANLDPIVLLFIVLSGTLAFVVLYNLTNINISERERELATIKVLGFFDNEVTMYILRENIIFTIIGILLGFGIGRILTWFIITMASSDLVGFPLIIPLAGYVISAAMTIIFSIIVMLITHRKLKQIDMIGALKSND